MVEPALKFLNTRMSELIREFDERKKASRGAAILQELAELSVIRDELKKFSGSGGREQQVGKALPQEFATVEKFFHRLNAVAQRIAKVRREDPERSEFLNEFTRLCLIADSLLNKAH